MAARRRETWLTDVIYRYHPRFAGTDVLYSPGEEWLEGGDVLLLAPGPINRGVELTPEVADGPHSAILQQVTNGLAVRMAVLYLLCGQPAAEE